MSQNPELVPGVGDMPINDPDRTAFLDFIAQEGLKATIQAAAELRTVAGSHSTEFLGAAQNAQQLQKVIAFMELGLREASYAQNHITRLPNSTIDTPPSDPLKPRSNL